MEYANEFTYNDLVDKVPYTGNYNADLLKVLSYLDPNKSSSYNNWFWCLKIGKPSQQQNAYADTILKISLEHTTV